MSVNSKKIGILVWAIFSRNARKSLHRRILEKNTHNTKASDIHIVKDLLLLSDNP